MAQHPTELIKAGSGKFHCWLANPKATHPSEVLGAIGELVAADALDAEIVSVVEKDYDIATKEYRYEVKARMNTSKRKLSLGGKKFDYVCRLILAREPVIGKPDELWGELLEFRRRGDNSPGNWAPVEGFSRRRVDDLVPGGPTAADSASGKA